MSQVTTSHIEKITCDACGKEITIEMKNIQPEAIRAVQDMYAIARKVFDINSGRFLDMVVQACSLSCVPAAALKLELPAQQAAAEIDLAALRYQRDVPDPAVN